MNITYYQDGERASATILNRPLTEIKSAVDSLEARMTAEENEDHYVENGITVFQKENGWKEYTISTYPSPGSYPSCPNDMFFWEIGKFHRNGSRQIEIDIVSTHRGMSTTWYREDIKLRTSNSYDGFYIQGTKRGPANFIGFLVNDGVDLTNDVTKYVRVVPTSDAKLVRAEDDANGVPQLVRDGSVNEWTPFGFTVKAIEDDAWQNSKLILAIVPSCGAGKSVYATVRWYGNSGDVTPLSVATYSNVQNSTSVQVTNAPAIHNT